MLHERLHGGVDHRRLAACAERVLHRHETFRLRFADSVGVPFQRVAPEAVRVAVVDLSDAPEPDTARADWMRASMGRALPMDGGPLTEATVLLEGADVTHLHVKAHHIVADGWTLDRLGHEILREYADAPQVGGAPEGDRRESDGKPLPTWRSSRRTPPTSRGPTATATAPSTGGTSRA